MSMLLDYAEKDLKSFIKHLLLSWKVINSKEDSNKVKRKDEIEPNANCEIEPSVDCEEKGSWRKHRKPISYNSEKIQN